LKKSLPDELTEFESGDRVLFDGTGIEITFIDAATALPIRCLSLNILILKLKSELRLRMDSRPFMKFTDIV